MNLIYKINKAGLLALVVSLNLFFINDLCKAEEQTISATLEKGIGQYKHENYEEALITLKMAREESPESSLVAYYLGLTYKQLQDYDNAIMYFKDAVTFSPKIKGALIELIDCYYQIGETKEARYWIGIAEEEGIRPAQIAFLKGLILLKEDDCEGAIASFKNAKALDRSMRQPADYQIAMCHLKSGKLTAAKKAFEQVVIVNPGSNMANFANEYMDAIERRRETTKPLKLSFGVAWQYDDNVVLKPDDSSLVTAVADKGDSREVYTADIEYDKRLGKYFGIKGQYLCYLAKQNDLGFYDTFSNTFALQPSIYFENSLLTFPATYNHTSVNDKAYLSTPSVSAIYNLMVGDANMGQAYLTYQYKDFLWEPSTLDEDRDGNNFGGGIGWYLFFAGNKGFLNLRYGLNREWTSGDNWEYIGNRATATLLIPVIDKLNATVSGDVYFQDFTKTHTVYSVHRRDRVYTLSTLLAYKFFKDSEIQLQYTFINDDSNISIYDYTRNIYSVGVEVKF